MVRFCYLRCRNWTTVKLWKPSPSLSCSSLAPLLALQAAANVQLSGAMGSPCGAATLQLGIGALLLLLAALVAGTLGAFAVLDEAPAWHLVGGLGSSLYITSGILLFPRLGALLTVGLWIAGQMLASLALDGFGWLGVAQDTPGAAQLLGGVAVVVGAAVIVRTQAGADTLRSALREHTGWLGLGVLAGAALPIQGAINAQLRADLDAPVTAGAVSFVVATAGMALLLAAALALGAPRPRLKPLHHLPWWGWVGGLVGATYVTSVFLLIPEIGAAPTIALTVAGQQVASVFVDRYGLMRLPARPVTPTRLAAVALLLAGVLLITLA
jgi:bacterial/archaeal transporter family-2 protein